MHVPTGLHPYAEPPRICDDGLLSPSDGAVTFDPAAFRAWLAAADSQGRIRSTYLIPDVIDPGDHDAGAMVEDLLQELGGGGHPHVWRLPAGVERVDIWRTADSDGIDGGGLPTVELTSGVTLAARHLAADDLVFGYEPDDEEMPGVDAAVIALTAVVGSVNSTLWQYRPAAACCSAQPSEGRLADQPGLPPAGHRKKFLSVAGGSNAAGGPSTSRSLLSEPGGRDRNDGS